MNKTPVKIRKKTLSSVEVAEMLECSTITVHRLIDRGELDDFRLTDHGWRRITQVSLQAYLTRRAKARRKRA